MLAAHQPQAGRGRRPHAADALPRVLGVHRREGRGERGHGRRASPSTSRSSWRWPRPGVSARGSTTSSMAAHGGGERADPPRDRHERGHRRAGPVQPRQRHDRPRLRPAVAEPARAAPCPASPTWARRATTTPTTASRFAENEERSPWEPFHVAARLQADRQHRQRVQRLPLDRVHPRPARAALARARAQHAARHGPARRRRPSLLDPITARQFVDRGGFDTKEKLIDVGPRERRGCRAGEYWDYQLVQNYVYPRATFGEEPYASMLAAAPGRADPASSSARRSTWSSWAARPTATGASWAALPDDGLGGRLAVSALRASGPASPPREGG